MLQVTESAKQELKKILSAKVDEPMAGLRLNVGNPGEFGLSIDVEEPGDQVFEHEGVKVLLVEQGLASSLEGVTIDYQDTPEGSRLVIFKEA
jgi:Fe-S cluster assembly iron-binding protein IscA